jgi:predicted ABC-type ATPase
MASIQPRILILAGPNGAGKTTFARDYLPHVAHCPLFVNADLIAAGLSPFAPEAAAFQAGRLMLAEIESHVLARRTFAFETTLSGLVYARKIKTWRALGYAVELHFLSLPDSQTAKQRVALRVAQGGHSIHDDVIERRFENGLKNFETIYKQLVDEWFLYNGDESPAQLTSKGKSYE